MNLWPVEHFCPYFFFRSCFIFKNSLKLSEKSRVKIAEGLIWYDSNFDSAQISLFDISSFHFFTFLHSTSQYLNPDQFLDQA